LKTTVPVADWKLGQLLLLPVKQLSYALSFEVGIGIALNERTVP